MNRAAVLAALMLATQAARADPVADFYSGRQVNLIVGYGTGGGYDVYGRLMARHLGRHIPGSPNVVVQNMPGAGSLRAVNYLYNTAPKDGTAIATFGRDMPLIGIIGHNTERALRCRASSPGSARRRAMPTMPTCCSCARMQRSTRSRMRAAPGGPPLVLGGTGEGSTGNDVPILLRDALGLNIKLIAGYPDSNCDLPRGRSQGARRPSDRAIGHAVVARRLAQAGQRHAHPAAVRARHAPSAIARRADRARARARRTRTRADRACRIALSAVAPVRGAARYSGGSRARPCRRRSWRCSATRFISTTRRGSRST